MIGEIIISLIKIFFMNLSIMISYIKIKGNKDEDKKFIIYLILINFIIAIGYTKIYEEFSSYIIPFVLNLFCYILYSLIISLVLDRLNKNYFTIGLMAISFSLMSFLLSLFIVFYTKKMLALENIINYVMEFFIVGLIQLAITYYFFKIKRFKDGFSFIKDYKFKRSTELISIILIMVILIVIIFIIYKDRLVGRLALLLMSLGMLLIIYLIRKYITMHYKSKMKDRTVEILTEKIEEKDKIIEDLRKELDTVLNINHKYNHRISAAEKAISKLKFNEEFASENLEIIDLVNKLSKDYKTEMSIIDNKNILPKTQIYAIDNMLEYMANNAKENNITFKVEVNCNVKNILIENIIKESKLETLLADHINDAIIAIKYSSNEHNKILVKFEKVDDIYEIKILDTGIEFEIDTLLKLGKEQVTTHKDNGGNGIGFVTTFNTLKECKGSLIIEEYNQEENPYTKAIIIRFDNANEYKIHSYRADEIKKQDTKDKVEVYK